MQALLIPLRLKHVASDALTKSLKDTALALPGPPDYSWRLKSVAGDPYLGVSLTLLTLTPAARARSGSSPPLSGISEARYLWFQKWIRWGG